MGVEKITNYFTKGRSRSYFNRMSIILIQELNKFDGTRASKDKLLNYMEYFAHLITKNMIHYDMAMDLWQNLFKQTYSYVNTKDKKSKKVYPNLKIVVKRLKE